MKRSILALTAALLIAATAAPVLADDSDGNYRNLNTARGQQKLFSSQR